MYSNDQQQEMLSAAKESILYGLENGSRMPLPDQHYAAPLHEYRASFVTLKLHGRLRGCIGSLQATEPLITNIIKNAYSAAFKDPRFPPLSREEFTQLELEISILGPPAAIPCKSEEELIRQLQPGVDGLILSEGTRSATFLPSVWEQLSDKSNFVRELKLKAGFPRDYWSEEVSVSRYTVERVR